MAGVELEGSLGSFSAMVVLLERQVRPSAVLTLELDDADSHLSGTQSLGGAPVIKIKSILTQYFFKKILESALEGWLSD